MQGVYFSKRWSCVTKANVSPELCVLRVHHCRTFCEDFSDAHSADLLLDSSRHLLHLRNNDFLQNHAKHSGTKQVKGQL